MPGLLGSHLASFNLPLKHRSFPNVFTVPKEGRIQSMDGPMPLPQPLLCSREISFRGLTPMG